MSLNLLNVVDAIGIEPDSQNIILTIVDSWDWQDEQMHLLALQEKINAYFDFIASGQLDTAYPNNGNQKIVIDIVCRYVMTQNAKYLLKKAEQVGLDLDLKIRTRYIPSENDSTNGDDENHPV